MGKHCGKDFSKKELFNYLSDLRALGYINFSNDYFSEFFIDYLTIAGDREYVQVSKAFEDHLDRVIYPENVDAKYYNIMTMRTRAFSNKENIVFEEEDGKIGSLIGVQGFATTDTYLTKQFDIEGVELSVGEWQKMAMARFFYKDAAVKILDEPSSSMDVFSHDKTLAYVLGEKDRTVFLISHRLIDYRNIDRVISLENGSVVEDDAPEILRTQNGLFSSWLKANAIEG